MFQSKVFHTIKFMCIIKVFNVLIRVNYKKKATYFLSTILLFQELVAYGADLDRSQISLGSFISTPLYITIAYDHFHCFKTLLQVTIKHLLLFKESSFR